MISEVNSLDEIGNNLYISPKNLSGHLPPETVKFRKRQHRNHTTYDPAGTHTLVSRYDLLKSYRAEIVIRSGS